MAKITKRCFPSANATIQGRVENNTMYLRQAGATADVPEFGIKAELCCNVIGDNVIVQITKPGVEGWTNVIFNAQSLISAAIDAARDVGCPQLPPEPKKKP